MTAQSIQGWLKGLRIFDLPEETWQQRYEQSTGKIPMVVSEVFYHRFITPGSLENTSSVQLEPNLESTLEPMTEQQIRDAGVVAIVRTATLKNEPIAVPKGSHQVFKAYCIGHYEK